MSPRAHRLTQGPPLPLITLPQELARYTRIRSGWSSGNELTLLRAGRQAYPAMLEAIANAKRTIHLEVYILEADGTGKRFADALIERAAAGVTVRVLYDAVGSFGLSGAFLNRLTSAGIAVVEYHPVAPWRRRYGWSHRDHRKLLVVDDEIGFVGGLNIADHYADVTDGGAGWHDIHCRVRGPVVHELTILFRRVWTYGGGKPFSTKRQPVASPMPPIDPVPAPITTLVPVYARVVANSLIRRRGSFRRAYLTAIRHARESIEIANSYFLPDRGVRRALYRAAARGITVRIIVPGRSDVRVAELAGLYEFRRAAEAGVQVRLWRGVMMHAKTAVIDGVWGMIGSYNLDAQSLRYNLEVAIETLDATHGAIMRKQFEHDIANTDAFDEAAWLQLPWWKKAASWVAHLFARWM